MLLTTTMELVPFSSDLGRDFDMYFEDQNFEIRALRPSFYFSNNQIVSIERLDLYLVGGSLLNVLRILLALMVLL